MTKKKKKLIHIYCKYYSNMSTFSPAHISMFKARVFTSWARVF